MYIFYPSCCISPSIRSKYQNNTNTTNTEKSDYKIKPPSSSSSSFLSSSSGKIIHTPLVSFPSLFHLLLSFGFLCGISTSLSQFEPR